MDLSLVAIMTPLFLGDPFPVEANTDSFSTLTLFQTLKGSTLLENLKNKR